MQLRSWIGVWVSFGLGWGSTRGAGETLEDRESESFHREVASIAADARGRVGVGIRVLDTGGEFLLGGDERYPMQSVYKFPIAMAVLEQVDAGNLDLEQDVRIDPAEFISPAQHSPLRDAHPRGVVLPLQEILRLAVSESDGTASDVALRLIGGPAAVRDFLARLGVSGIAVMDTEMEIGREKSVQYRNYAKPRAVLDLLAALHEGRGLSTHSHLQLRRWMTETSTGKRRLKALLPAGTEVVHKTGGSRTIDGVAAATNDVGLILFPDGRVLAIAVFVSDARAEGRTREAVIARIARAAWDRWSEPHDVRGAPAPTDRPR